MRYFILVVVTLFFAGCTKKPKQSARALPHVVATTGILYDAVINIGGDKVTTEVLMGPGVDPHLYKATQGDLSKLNAADLIIYNGIMLEGKMGEILQKLGRQKPTLAAAESIPDSLLIRHANYDDAMDPHVWFDVTRWKYVVKEIGAALAKLDTTHQAYYLTNQTSYLKRLDSLDHFVQQRIKEIPEKQRILVTAHDAFGYFGQAYGLRVEAVQGMSTVSDFGLKDIANLIDLIIANDIKAIFVETSVSEKSINAVITGCRDQGHEVTIGGNLFSDAMGDLNTYEGTYIGMFTTNINTIADALK